MNIFSPDFKVESSSGSNFLNAPGKGETIRFYPVGSVVGGYEYWTTEGRTKRLKVKPETTPADIRTDGKFKERVKQFIALPVYDYADGEVKIAQFSQASIIGDLYKFYTEPNEDLDPEQCFVKIEREDKGSKVSYKFSPVPFTSNGKNQKPSADAFAEAAKLDLQDLLFREQEEAQAESNGQTVPVSVNEASNVM